MRKSLVALFALNAVISAAQADDGVSVQLYGVLDEGFAHIDHSPSANQEFAFSLNPYNIAAQGQGSVNAMVSGGASMSRWGIQGNEDLGGGLKAFFRLESAINLNSGEIANNGQTVLENANSLGTISGASSINGQFFSRAAYVGLGDSTLGSITFGRIPAFSYDQTVEFDPLQASGLYSPIGFSGTIGGGLGITESVRLDNAIRYQSTVGAFSFGVEYKIPETNNPDAADVGSVLEEMLAYRNGPFSIEWVGSHSKNTPALSFKLFTNDVGLRVSDTTGYMLTGRYVVSDSLSFDAGYERTNQTTPSASNDWSTQITTYYGMSLAGYVTAQAFNPTWGTAEITTAWVGGVYNFTNNFKLDFAYYNVNNAANNHNDQYTIQALSFIADYSFSKRTDSYVGLMFTNYNGAYLTQQSPPALVTNNAIVGAGLRVRF